MFEEQSRVLTNPDGILNQNNDHMRITNGSISDSTCGGISDRSDPGDMLMENQDPVKVKPTVDLHLIQPAAKQINFPAFKLGRHVQSGEISRSRVCITDRLTH